MPSGSQSSRGKWQKQFRSRSGAKSTNSNHGPKSEIDGGERSTLKPKVLQKSKSFVGKKSSKSSFMTHTPNPKNLSYIGTGVLNAQKVGLLSSRNQSSKNSPLTQSKTKKKKKQPQVVSFTLKAQKKSPVEK